MSVDLKHPGIPRFNCQHCGASIRPHDQGFCEKSACRQARLQEQNRLMRERKIHRRQKFAAQLDELVAHWQEDNSLPTDTPTVEIPYVGNATEAPGREQIEAFTEHLQFLLDNLEDGEAEEKFEASHEVEEQAHLQRLSASICGTCGGNCCKQGSQFNAFIQRRTLARALASQQALNRENLLATYSQYIPAFHVSNSCLFHTPNGCYLPLALRADICSQFYCLPLADLISQEAEGERHSQYLVVSKDNDELKKLRLIATDGSFAEIWPRS